MPEPVPSPPPVPLPPVVPILVVTGTVGVGKTTIAAEIGDVLRERGVPHAVVDGDWLTNCWPGDERERFNHAVLFDNLRAMWPVFARFGATRLIVANVMESRDDAARYEDAVPGGVVRVCRLTASAVVVADRIRARNHGWALDWHLARAPELHGILERARPEDAIVDNGGGRSLRDVAIDVLHAVGW